MKKQTDNIQLPWEQAKAYNGKNDYWAFTTLDASKHRKGHRDTGAFGKSKVKRHRKKLDRLEKIVQKLKPEKRNA